ncbi:hypothetical protein P691DRAFT_809213 [Macrolepiota fuliginosa MF-IS2]|uniref:Protein kinase domain-containing protein n=1 Tax=Macrolepiota fuliginosa MF-IS2 TaxID=1400762 RepID=A0A9P5X286_9AGAR|nr:hypothetical protein P691DRAFT_809213 [Macrolepiota fuliginosa MF-IS2]
MLKSIVALVFPFLAGWVHRDISPDNILFQEDPNQKGKLIDFEFAKRVSSDHRMPDDMCMSGFIPYDMRVGAFRRRHYNPQHDL